MQWSIYTNVVTNVSQLGWTVHGMHGQFFILVSGICVLIDALIV